MQLFCVDQNLSSCRLIFWHSEVHFALGFNNNNLCIKLYAQSRFVRAILDEFVGGRSSHLLLRYKNASKRERLCANSKNSISICDHEAAESRTLNKSKIMHQHQRVVTPHFSVPSRASRDKNLFALRKCV